MINASLVPRLLGQGFAFNEPNEVLKARSPLPPNGRRIPVPSRIMSEMLGTLLYFKYNPGESVWRKTSVSLVLERIPLMTSQVNVCVY